MFARYGMVFTVFCLFYVACLCLEKALFPLFSFLFCVYLLCLFALLHAMRTVVEKCFFCTPILTMAGSNIASLICSVLIRINENVLSYSCDGLCAIQMEGCVQNTA